MTRRRRTVTIELPPEFVRLCERDQVKPEVADLCGIISWARDPRADGYCSNGSDERDYAAAYYERVGYPWLHRDP